MAEQKFDLSKKRAGQIPVKMEARVGDWFGRSFFEEKLIYKAQFNFWPILFLSGPGVYLL
jgi:hypothetical protein